MFREPFSLPDQVRDLCTYNPWFVMTDASLSEAIEKMVNFGFHHVPVVDQDKKPIGIISDRDLAKDLESCLTQLPMAERDVIVNQWKQRSVHSAMTPNVVSIDINSSPVNALQSLLERGFHALPVLQRDSLIGVITSSDFVREISFASHHVLKRMVSEVMEVDFELIDDNFTLEEAAQQFREMKSRYLIVIQGDFPIGVLSSSQVYTQQCRECLAMALGHPEDVQRVNQIGELVKSDPMIAPGKRICDAAELMVQHSIRSLAVANQSSRVCGFLTEDRLLQYLAQSLECSSGSRS